MNRTVTGLLAGVFLAALVLTGCGGKSANPPATQPAGGQGQSQLPPGVVAIYNNKKITQQQFDTRVHIFEYMYNQPLSSNAQAKNNILDDMVTRNLLYEDAVTKGFKANDKDVNDELDSLHKDLIDQVYKDKATSDKKMTELGITEQDLRDLVNVVATTRLMIQDMGNKTKPTDQEIKDYYDKHPDEFGEQIRASHILVDDEKQAKDLVAQLRAGADFAQLAKQYSKDTGSAANGGDLDYFGKGKMLPEFEQAAFALKVGEISDPVKTTYGYHIIKVTDRKPPRSFDDAKADIAKNLQDMKASEQAQQLVSDLKAKANIQTVTFS